MDSAAILTRVYLTTEDNQIPPEELVLLLEITSEELLRKFPRKVLEHCEKFGVYDYDDDTNESS